MLLKHLSRAERNLFYLAVIIIVIVMSYYFLVEPLWKKWKLLNETISSKEIQLLKNKKILAKRDIILQLYNKYAENIKMKGSDEEEKAVILREIENIARNSNTDIVNIKPLETEDRDFYKEYPVELETEGDISSLAKFIYDLQNSEQILKVKKLQLTPKDESGDVLSGYMVVTKILIV